MGRAMKNLRRGGNVAKKPPNPNPQVNEPKSKGGMGPGPIGRGIDKTGAR